MFKVFLVCAVALSSSLLAVEAKPCPPMSYSQAIDGKSICVFCADGSTYTMSFGSTQTCSCPGGKECDVTVRYDVLAFIYAPSIVVVFYLIDERRVTTSCRLTGKKRRLRNMLT